MSTLKDLTPDPKNRRRHTSRNVEMITEAIEQVGTGRSIVIDEDDVVLAGNATVKAAGLAGLTKLKIVEAEGDEVIAVRRRGLSSEQKRALAIYDNRTAELAEWDVEQLAEDVDAGLELEAFFEPVELDELLPPPDVEGVTDPDAVPEPSGTDIKVGDLFTLGDHRLLCGDSTKADDVARVMDGAKAQVVFTDPPYGVGYDGGMKKREKLRSDHIGTDIYEQSLRHLKAAADDAAPLYLWYADAHVAAAAAAAAGYAITAQIIWVKNNAQFVTSAKYKGKHEPCFYAHRKGKTARWHGPNNEVTVWECDRSARNDFHPTQKPVELAGRAITNSSLRGQIVLDLFVGGGTTIIAAEQLGRKCYAIEIEPSYCQVTIDRWEAFTGKTASKVT